jgi:hypothetical protein
MPTEKKTTSQAGKDTADKKSKKLDEAKAASSTKKSAKK